MSSVPWFYSPPDQWGSEEVILPGDESHHAIRVMRISPSDALTVTDGAGVVARCSAVRIESDRLVAAIVEREKRTRPRPEIVVYQGAAKGAKVDQVVERLAELGTSELVVYESRRSVVRWDKEKIEKLGARWQAIARSAAKQSRDPYMIKVSGGSSWNDLLRQLAGEPIVVVLWEEATVPLRAALPDRAERVAVVVGPEGGLAADEAQELASAGGHLVSLGPHILRTENAPIVAVSAVMYRFGLLG